MMCIRAETARDALLCGLQRTGNARLRRSNRERYAFASATRWINVGRVENGTLVARLTLRPALFSPKGAAAWSRREEAPDVGASQKRGEEAKKISNPNPGESVIRKTVISCVYIDQN